MTAVEKIASYSWFPREGGMPHQAGSVRKQRGRRKMWARAFIVIFEGRNGQGKVNWFWINLMNNFRRR